MLYGKKFFVKHTNMSSDTRHILDGLQQGTINSPILFSLYTNSILELYQLNSNNNTFAIAYADDVILYVTDDHVQTIEDKLTELLNKINTLHATWNLKLNPDKCEAILFRNSRKVMSISRAKGIHTFTITTIRPGTNITVKIPTKNTVTYLGYKLDNLVKGYAHIEDYIIKARKVLFGLSKIFHSKLISTRAKIICYMTFIRSLLIYAAPIWWNVGASHMEKLRRFERTCLRSALNINYTTESNFTRKISNKNLYNAADIPRIDNFIIKITRDYFANITKIPNKVMQQLSKPDEIIAKIAAVRGTLSPQDFIYHDRLGLIQDENNIPILYHWKRNRYNKRIPSMNEIKSHSNNWIYSKALLNNCCR